MCLARAWRHHGYARGVGATHMSGKHNGYARGAHVVGQREWLDRNARAGWVHGGHDEGKGRRTSCGVGRTRACSEGHPSSGGRGLPHGRAAERASWRGERLGHLVLRARRREAHDVQDMYLDSGDEPCGVLWSTRGTGGGGRGCAVRGGVRARRRYSCVVVCSVHHTLDTERLSRKSDVV